MIVLSQLIQDLKNSKKLVTELFSIFGIETNNEASVAIDRKDELIALYFKDGNCTSMINVSEYSLEFIQNWDTNCKEYTDNIRIKFSACKEEILVEGECIKDERCPAAYCGLKIFDFVNLLNRYRVEK